MLIKKLKRLYRRRKAVSPVVATLLLIALVVAATAVVFIIYYKVLRKSKLDAAIIGIKDTNKDSRFDEITLQIANTGTLTADIVNITIWTVPASVQGDQNYWVAHLGWEFTNPNQATLNPSEIINAKITGEDQIGLTFWEYTYYRLEMQFSGNSAPLITDWAKLNDFADLSDLLLTFENFNLTANAFEGTIDDPSRAANNYLTNDDGEYQLTENSQNYLPVLDEGVVPFYIGSQVVVFHSVNGNLTLQPLQQIFDTSDNPFRCTKFFMLGLTGSWGDEFPANEWALNVTYVYTDNSFDSYLLNKSYIDDWWYGSNPGGICISAPNGLITEIDLGTQADTPHSHIHTHTTRFFIDYYKYLKAIIFTDPGDDASAAHLLSLVVR
ncbi:MAG TPA: archaellin/type IV pilin N-terminal domain-containing protein [Candidatus Bathyarchaeia archaeon]|nr:archaellin/type IV pilin N-terminal domain-containing protein [Candidatus Bathyarchaeia archaeon]